ncbi:DUF3098 domain-containing protein [Siphonobacter sp. SORGH_AS_1065]|uniref:DUF3098 domain-containing protein n=1 Tax=Siphonobacter sp. SORGH_AS_1065 TaxID=3041795 RepID=UPI0027896433|nr:DUF3098 domain-containing protein [Siphonobacter sp. SORGH_AS_1065]MDQ1088749.1 putative Tic20 family protein [Siphonobacter sp. SORGH_AS_1065]
MATEFKTSGISSPFATGNDASAQAKAMPFQRSNYLWMIIGVVTILAGFFIMSMDREEFGFGFLGLTLGPIVVVAGYIIEFYAILQKPKA